MEVSEVDMSQGKAKFYPYPWAFVNSEAIKEALISRGLSTSGSRKTWSKRLSDYEAEVKKVHGESALKEGPEIPPRLLRVHMKCGYYLASYLKQVIIRPFKRQLLKVPGVTAWLDEASTYVFKKTKSGNSAAYLKFDTIDKGDAAYFDLKEKLQDHGAEVSHPPFQPIKYGELKNIEDPMETFMTEDFIKEEFAPRLIVLENLPAELNIDEKLCEIFTTALATVSFEHDPSSHGIAILEMPSVDEVNRLMGDEMTVEVTIEDQKIYASKYTNRANQWSTAVRVNKTELKRLGLASHRYHNEVDSDNEDSGLSTEKTVLTDNERLELSRELSLIKEGIVSTANQTDIFGLEKIQRHVALVEKMTDIYRPMVEDAKRRLACNLAIPEPWHLVPESIQDMINKGESAHCLKLDDLEEKFLKSKKEMEEASKELEKVAKSILCVEKQLGGEEASKWLARRPKLELEKVLNPKQPLVEKKAVYQTPQQAPEEPQYSVYDYGMSLSSVVSQLNDTSHNDNQATQDGSAASSVDYTEHAHRQTPRGGGKMGKAKKRDNKGKQKPGGGNVAMGYGNQGNKSMATDDYGQFGRRHEEIGGQQPQPHQQRGNSYDRKGFGPNVRGQGRGQGRGRGGGKPWNRHSAQEEEIGDTESSNDWGSFIKKMNVEGQQGRNNKAAGENQWSKATGMKGLGEELAGEGERGGQKNRKEKRQAERERGRRNQPEEQVDGNDWGQFVGKVFGELTGGGSGTVVTAEVPVKKRKDDQKVKEKILDTSQSQIKAPTQKTSSTDSSEPTNPQVQNLMDIPTGQTADASKKWHDDYNRLRQDILTDTEPANEKQGKAEKAPWTGHKFEPVEGEGEKGPEGDRVKAGIKFKWLNKESDDRKEDEGEANVQGGSLESTQKRDRIEHRDTRNDYRRSGNRPRDNGRRGRGRDQRRDGHRDNDRRGGQWQQQQASHRGNHREEEVVGGGQRDDTNQPWSRGGQRVQEEVVYRGEEQMETQQSGIGGQQQLAAPPVEGGNAALSKLSAIEAVLNEKMRKLQELQRSSMQTEMQMLAVAGQAGTNLGIGQNQMY